MRIFSKPVLLFLAFLCICSTAAYALVIHSHQENEALSHFLMWCPRFAALCTCFLLQIPLTTLGWNWPSRRFLTLAYLLPLMYATPVYLLTWLTVRHSFSLTRFEAATGRAYGLRTLSTFGVFGVAVPLSLTITVIGAATWALGEEIGWRGFLFPRLQRWCGFHGACLTSGVLWAWHLPGLLWADHHSGAARIYAMSCFTAGILGMSYIMGYLRVCSGSIWPCVLLRATHKSFVDGIVDPLTAPVGWATYITSDFGMGLALAIIVAATLMLSTRRGGGASRVGEDRVAKGPSNLYEFTG